MPSWQPNWEDVIFDYAAAEEAAHECDSCARFIDERHASLDPAIEEARREWRGVHRDRFDSDLMMLDREADLLAADLRLTAARIRASAEAARLEQRSREIAREQWLAEKRQEDLAAAAAAEAKAAAEKAAAERAAAEKAAAIRTAA